MIKGPRRHYELFLATYLLVTGGALYALFALLELGELGGQTRSGETLSYRLVWLILYAILIQKIVSSASIIAPLLIRNSLLIVFSLSATLSAALNGMDVQAQIKFMMYFMTIAGGIWLASLNKVDRVLDTFLHVGILVLLYHVLLYMVIDTEWIEYDGRSTILGTAAYPGTFGHKNMAGVFFGLSALVCLVRALSAGGSSRIKYFLLMLLHLLMVGWAGAVGSLLSVAVAFAMTLWIRTIARQRRPLATSYLILGIAAAFAVPIVGVSGILELVGRDADLTGRTFLWSTWPHFFWERPLFGYGYSNFFSERVDSPAWTLWSMGPLGLHARHLAPNFQNSYLEAAIDFGIVGSLIFYLILAKAMWTAFRFACSSSSVYAAAPFAMIVFLLGSALGESSLSLHNNLPCVLIFWVYFGIEMSFSSRPQSAARGSRWATHRQGTKSQIITSMYNIALNPSVPTVRRINRHHLWKARTLLRLFPLFSKSRSRIWRDGHCLGTDQQPPAL